MSDFQQNSTNSSTSSNVENPFNPAVDGKATSDKVYQVVIALSKYVNDMKSEYEKERDKVSDSIKRHKEELENARTDNSKSLGIFVALFTFVSVSFSILPRISHPLILLGFLFVLLGSLTFLVLLLAWILDIQRYKWFTTKQIVIGLLAFILLILGLASACFGYEDMKNNDFYTQGEVDALLNVQRELLETQLKDGEKYTNETISNFKTCVAIHGLWSCVRE